MARLLGAKRKKAGMGAAKFPGKKTAKKVKAVGKTAKSSAKKVAKSAGGRKARKSNPTLWMARKGKKYSWQKSEGEIKQGIAKYRQKHHSLSKSARPALKPNIKKYARIYFKKTRAGKKKLKFYDKVRGKFYRSTLKKKYGTTRTSFYNENNQAGRRPRAGSRTRAYTKSKGKPGRPKKTVAKKPGRPKKTVAKKRGRPAKKK